MIRWSLLLSRMSTKPISRFAGRYAKNREYYREKSRLDRERMKADPPRLLAQQRKAWAWRIQDVYGLSVEDFAWMLHGQEFKCAIRACGQVLFLDKFTHIDHEHSGNQRIRGILCNHCNNVLGKVAERPAVLRELATYLERHS